MARKQAQAYAVAVEIYCPAYPEDCKREEPIPARDGSFMWDSVPETATCPDCKRTWKVRKTITF